MDYKGKLYGKVGNGYIPLLQDTNYVHRLEEKVKELESRNELSNLLAIRDYLMKKGANDESLNDRIKELTQNKNGL